MTTRDYERIADAVREVTERDPIVGAVPMLEVLCTVFKRDNPRFIRGVFMHRALGYIPERPLEEP